MIDFNAINSDPKGLLRFEVYRDEEIRVSSTQFCGGGTVKRNALGDERCEGRVGEAACPAVPDPPVRSAISKPHPR